MQNNAVTVGVDIGGTNTAIGFIDENGNYLKGDSFSTNGFEKSDVFAKRLSDKILSGLSDIGNGHQLAGIGVAAPGGNYLTGNIESPANLNWGTVNFVKLLKQYFDIPIAVTNDANAAALGEQYFGLGKGIKNFVVITLGTGLGSGIVVESELLYGGNGLAGELGHTIIEPDGRECNCGRRGCLETYVSATGIKRTIQVLLGNSNEPSELRNISFNKLDGETITNLALDGDSIALRSFIFTGIIFGRALANLVACFAPESIILFGGLAEAGDLIIQPTLHSMEKNLLSFYQGNVQILKSEMQNGKSAVLGASCLISKDRNNGSLLRFARN